MLVGGERATIMIIATDRRQAAVIFKYLREMLGIPLLNGIIERETNELTASRPRSRPPPSARFEATRLSWHWQTSWRFG